MHQLGKKGYREPSIEVRGDWPVLIEFSKNQLDKLNPVVPNMVEERVQCGEVYKYDQELDKSSSRRPVNL